MSEINLLPREYVPKGYVLKVSGTLKKISALAVAGLIISIIGVSALYGINYTKSSAMLKQQEDLVVQVNSLKASEQKYYLIKDRLDKITLIRQEQSASGEVDVLESIVRSLPENIKFKSAELKPGAAEIEITTNSSKDIARFFTHVVDKGYIPVVLSSLDYSKNNGYSVSVIVSANKL